VKEPSRRGRTPLFGVLTAIVAAPTFRLAHQIVGSRLADLFRKSLGWRRGFFIFWLGYSGSSESFISENIENRLHNRLNERPRQFHADLLRRGASGWCLNLDERTAPKLWPLAFL
jgi:hypothetical protein